MDKQQILKKLSDPDFGLDGVWSSQSLAIKKHHGAENIELNKWWALTSQNWKCPCCSKPKKEIARTNASGTLIAKLVSHHDHICDLDETQFTISNANVPSRKENSELREYLKRLANGFLCRFKPAIICEECNNIEVELKKRFKLPAHVTLSPIEIGILRSFQHNPDSEVIRDLVSKLRTWAETIVQHLRSAVDGFDAEIHAKQLNHVFRADYVESSAKGVLEHNFSENLDEISTLLGQFLELSVSNPTASHARDAVLPNPTCKQFEEYRHPHEQRQKYWNKVDKKWVCPICRRNKFECFRSSPKSKNIFNGSFYPKSSSQIHVESEDADELIICQDCNDFPSVFRKYLREQRKGHILPQVEEWLLNSDIVRKGITARPHQRHTYDIEEALNCIETLLHSLSKDIEVDF